MYNKSISSKAGHTNVTVTERPREDTDLFIIRQASNGAKTLSDLSDKDGLSENIQQRLNDEKVKEQQQRRIFRWVMFGVFTLLLFLQYAGLSFLIYFAIKRNILTNIQPMLAVVMPSTLGETYGIIKVMVKFVFSEGDFSSPVEK